MHSRKTFVVLSLVVLSLLLFSGVGVFAGESPMLRERVERGELPPLEERLPKEPLVVEPRETIGKYGGTLYAPVESMQGSGNDVFLMGPLVSFALPRPEDQMLLPNFAKEIESNEDATAWTITFREGVKWSDGHPFTVDDILFWYEAIYLNDELTSEAAEPWIVKGQVAKIDKIDDFTLRFTYPEPMPFFKNYLVTASYTILFPSHYLKQFHPNYTSEEELKKIMEAEGFDTWVDLFEYKSTSHWGIPMVEDLPTLAAYRLVSRSASRRVYERNPYYWKVDTEGNQLPYIDTIVGLYVSDQQMISGMVMSGEIDFADRVGLENYPLYQQYKEQGGYETYLYNIGRGAQMVFMINRTVEDDVLREIFQNPTFAQALSLAIDRDEINEVFYFGLAQPRQYTVLDTSQYFEPEFATAYAEFDPDRANAMLDSMGLDKRDSQGFRLRPDGQRLGFTIQMYERSDLSIAKVEIVMGYWRDHLGIDVRLQQISPELQEVRAPANQMEATIWAGDKSTDILFPMGNNLIIPKEPRWDESVWPKWGLWFNTNGADGWEPPEHVKQVRAWYDQMLVEPDEQKRIELGKNILRVQAEYLWQIGNVGNVPELMIFNAKLRNLPDPAVTVRAWDTGLYSATHPEQIFFDD